MLESKIIENPVNSDHISEHYSRDSIAEYFDELEGYRNQYRRNKFQTSDLLEKEFFQNRSRDLANKAFKNV